MKVNRISSSAMPILLFLAFATAPPVKGQERAAPAPAETSSLARSQGASGEPGELLQSTQTPANQTPAGQSQNGTANPQQNDKPATVHLTSRQKLKYGTYKAFVTPGAYLGPAINAFFVERRDVKALGKTGEDKFADGLSRFARAFATRSSAELLGEGVYPALFKQNPIYQPSGRHGFMSRTGYALSRTFLTSGDNGKTQPNFSRLLGDLTSASLANVYERDIVRRRDRFGRVLEYHRRVGVEPTLKYFAISTAFQAVSHVLFDEFNILAKLQKKASKKPQPDPGP
jgi:hypothetical protein